MTFLKLAWRNVWRNTSRTLIQVAVIAGSLMFVIWSQNVATGSYDKMIEDSVRTGSGHLAFQHPDYLKERRSELFIDANLPITLSKSIPEIVNVLPRLQIPGLIRSSRENCSAMILGVDFDVEKTINIVLAEKRRVAGQLPENGDEKRAYVGEKLATRLRTKVGQKMVFMFQNAEGIITSKLYRIAGIFRSGVGKIDSGMVFVDRNGLAKAFGDENAAHEIALILDNRSSIDKVKSAIDEQFSAEQKEKLALLPWDITMKQVADAMKLDHANLKFMIFLLYVLVTIGTINLLLMSVLERTREFGLLRAIGLEQSRIRRLIGLESILIGIIGGVIGFLGGTSASFYSWYYGLDFTRLFEAQEVAGMLFEPIIRSNWNWDWMTGLTFAMVIMVYLASIYPAGKAMRINPSEAMRKY